MRKFALLTLALVGCLALFGFWLFVSIQAPSSDKTEKRFVITKGTSAVSIGDKLKDAGLIKNPLAFKVLVQFSGVSTKIQAGEYSLPANLNLFSLIGELLKGPRLVWVTIPEGVRREEIVEKYVTGLGIPDDRAQNFRNEFLETSKAHEGYLFPDTYLLPKDATGSAVAKLMRATFDKRVDFEVTEAQIIVASILERETVTEEERPIVAGILFKRVEAGWPLQADATVQYALGDSSSWWPRPLTKEDLAIASPYNSYKNPGLPPTPISNPGLSSIKAAANPQESPYWFYLHDSEGVIHYAATLEEHNQNIKIYLGK